MQSAEEIIREAESLPVEQRAAIVDRLLRTLNPPDPAVDSEWIRVASRRLAELRSGSVTPVPAEDVIARIEKHFG